jgi:AcrR family transcriptional regulator
MSNIDGQKSRSFATQKALMLAAEKLIAENGIKNVSIKEIVKTAGQKNESALQYHFKNFQGLVKALQDFRSEEIRERRELILEELLKETKKPKLRDLCRLMVLPSFQLCQSSVEHRRFVIGFSHGVTMTENSAMEVVGKFGGRGTSGQRTRRLLRDALPHLDEISYRQRMDSAIRLCTASMNHHARQKQAFKGDNAAFFLNSLLDSLEGLLKAPVTKETQKFLKKS